MRVGKKYLSADPFSVVVLRRMNERLPRRARARRVLSRRLFTVLIINNSYNKVENYYKITIYFLNLASSIQSRKMETDEYYQVKNTTCFCLTCSLIMLDPCCSDNIISVSGHYLYISDRNFTPVCQYAYCSC